MNSSEIDEGPDVYTVLQKVKTELDTHFAKHGLKMTRNGVCDIETGALLQACTTAAEMVQFALAEIDRRRA